MLVKWLGTRTFRGGESGSGYTVREEIDRSFPSCDKRRS